MTSQTPDGDLHAAAFRPEDPDLAGLPPLESPCAHRAGGVTLADTTRATLLFETPLPTRFYLPPEDVAMDLLVPSASSTVSANLDRLTAAGGGMSEHDVMRYSG